jgi:TPR repeat protein
MLPTRSGTSMLLPRFAVGALLVVTSAIATPAFADAPATLVAPQAVGLLYDKGDFSTALSTAVPLAESGDATAQYYLGMMYANGKGVAKDEVVAVSWYRKAAGRGHAPAQARLGDVYARGLGGVAKDDVKAVAWYRKAADQDCPYGQSMLATMYARGAGVDKDFEQSRYWLKRSSENLQLVGRNSR